MPSFIPKSLHDDCNGLSTVEYIIILGLIAIASIGAWQTFGTTISAEAAEATEYIQVVE